MMIRNMDFSSAIIKKILSVAVCICIIFCMGTAIFAVDDEPVGDAPAEDTVTGDEIQDVSGTEDTPSEPEEPVDGDQSGSSGTTELASCICGRPYYTADGDKHYKYDCIGCGENLYMCKCACWCGADSYSGMSNIGTQQLYCSNCKKACSECVCADKETALLRESEIRNGTLSVMGIKKPESVFPILFLLVITVAVFGACIYSYRYVYGREMPVVPGKAKPSADRPKGPSPKAPHDTSAFRLPQVPEQWPFKGRAPAMGLYAGAAHHITGRRSSAPGASPLVGAKKMTLTADDMAGLINLSGLQNNNPSIHLGKESNVYTNLLSLGFAVEGESSVSLTDKGTVYARVLFTPDEVITVGAASSAVYNVCFLRGYGIAVIREKGGYTLITDIKKPALAEFVRDNLEPTGKGNSRTGNFSSTLSYEEWTVLLAAYSEKEGFAASSLSRVEKVNSVNAILSSASVISKYPPAEKVLDTESVAACLESLVSKGFIEETDGNYSFTDRGRSLNYRDLKDTVFFDRRVLDGSGMEIALLAVYHSSSECGDAVILICDTGSDVRIVSSGSIPWDKYMG